MGQQDDPYLRLGVDRGASTREIRRAYRRLARRHHPDLNPDRGSAGRFTAVADAYAVLGHPARRARYDRSTPASPAPVSSAADPRRGSPQVQRRAVLELSSREACHLAHAPLTLTGARGEAITLPAGVRAGDQICIPHREGMLVLRICVAGP